MLMAEDIQNVYFSRSVGGYKASDVDEFMDRCAETVNSLTIAKNELEKKLEVLADKLIEYRNDEDNIRTALMSAQKLADTVVREAKHKAGLILDDARIKSDKILENAQLGIKEEQQELDRLKREVTNFKARMLSIYREHLSLIDVLPEVKDEEKEDEQVEEQAETVQQQEQAAKGDDTKLANKAEALDEAQGAVPDTKNEKQDEQTGDSDFLISSDSKSKFKDLKFGEEYDITKDDDEENIGLFKRRK